MKPVLMRAVACESVFCALLLMAATAQRPPTGLTHLQLVRSADSLSTADEEYRVKAAFIFHFAQLVDWPAETPAGTDNSLVLCTLGEDPFQGVLEGTIAGKAIGKRMLRIRHLGEPPEMQACQIVFLGRAQSKRIPMLVSTLHNAPVLTVGETADFLDAGGMIDFLTEGEKVRFEVNLAAAESADLKIGSRLLVLAQRVVGESHDK